MRGKYEYGYVEYVLTDLMMKLCCCCSKKPCYERRKQKLERHEEATSRLESELDIVNFIYVHRLSKFMAKLSLKTQ